MSEIYRGGVPTKISVQELIEEWPPEAMKVGDKFPYSEVEKITGVNYHTPDKIGRSSRWSTVTLAWRRQVERETGLIIGCEAETRSFTVLDNSQRVRLSGSKMKIAKKAIARSVHVASTTGDEGLTEPEKLRRDWYTLVGSRLQAAHEALKLRGQTEVKQLEEGGS